MGIARIDEQHKKLIDLINEMSEIILNNKNPQFVEILEELADWTEKHFTGEEALFSGTAYPDEEKHKEEHRYFVEKVRSFQAQQDSKDLSVSLNILQFLRNWLFYHIEIIDKAYAPYVEKDQKRLKY